MIEKLLLNELTLNPAGTLAEGAAVDGDADDVGEAVVADEFLLLLPHAAVSPAKPTTAMPTSNRRGRRYLAISMNIPFCRKPQDGCSSLNPGPAGGRIRPKS
jgi:hypothetical protein